MTEDCIFCRIASGQTDTPFVYESKTFVAFRDINPKAPVHVLLAPKEHIPSLQQVTDSQREMLTEVCLAIPGIARQLGVAESGYKVVINTGRDGGQSVEHLHFHLLGGKQLPEMF